MPAMSALPATSAISALRREPFRALFPLAVLIAWAGVSPWVLFGGGFMRFWPGTYHALAMTQGFLVAVAVGFLATMIPRRTGAPPISTLELVLALTGLFIIPVALVLNRLAVAQVVYLGVIALMAQFALRRMRGSSKQPMPPSFLFIPIGLLAGVAGAVLMLLFSVAGGPPWCFMAGRTLVEEGVLLGLVMAIAPLLASPIMHGTAAESGSPARARVLRAVHLLAAALFVASFALQFALSERAGLLLRGLVLAFEMVWAARLLEEPRSPGLHRRLFRVALLFIPLGPLVAAARPGLRVPALHLTFIGGFSLLVFAVSYHVVFLHTHRDSLAVKNTLPVFFVGALTLLATVARVFAEQTGAHYVEALTLASSLWVLASLIWGAQVIYLILRPAPPTVA